MTTGPVPRGTIYDLSYEGYDGPRLGRRFAVWSLYVLSVRSAFGLGRGALPKVLAFGLVLVALIPALVQVMIAAISPEEDFSFVQPHEYYSFIQIIILLFTAALASDLVGNDRRYGTLVLYFSRPIRWSDYGAAKLAALATGLLAVTLLPQTVMFFGNWLGAADGLDWAEANAVDFAPIVGSGLMISLTFAAVGLLTAAYAERRAFAIISVLAIFLVPFIVVNGIAEISDDANYAAFASPVHVMRAFTLVLFNEIPTGAALGDGPDSVIASIDLPRGMFILAGFAYAAVAAALLLTRLRRSV